MVVELGIISIKGFIENFSPTDVEDHATPLYFMCPNPDCTKHPKDSILGIISIPTARAKNVKVWEYKIIDENHISVSPSILCIDDFHCGIPTYFELVKSMEELYEK